MKLARIEHARCGEPAGRWGISTYVWVPDTMTEEELQTHVDAAMKSYLDAEEQAKYYAPQAPPGYGPAIHPNTPDDKTVGQLREEYETAVKSYKQCQEALDRARKGFAWHLFTVSKGVILQFWDHKPGIQAEADWGHRHGTYIEYNGTQINDFPKPQGEEEESDEL